MGEQQHITDESSERKYFHMMLNMADDDLDPFQYRLLGHYLRRCGKSGYCNEGVRTTAKVTRMSTTKVIEAREALATLGYIRQQKPTPEAAHKGETVSITIVDRWVENVNRYAQEGVPNIAQGVPDLTHPVPNMEQVLAQGVPNMERKYIEKNIEPKERTAAKAARESNAAKTEETAAALTIQGNPSKIEAEDKTSPKVPQKGSPPGGLEDKFPNAYAAFHANIGTLTGIIADDIKDLIEVEHVPETWIVEACEESARQNIRRWKYAYAIIRRWQRDGKDNGKAAATSTASIANYYKPLPGYSNEFDPEEVEEHDV